MKYKIIPEDTIKNLIEFLDEIHFEAAKVNTTDAHHQVNFCNWAINELINSYNVMATKDFRKTKDDKKKPGNFSKQNQCKSIFTIFEIFDLHWLSIEKFPDFDRPFCSRKFQLEDALTFDSSKIFELGKK